MIEASFKYDFVISYAGEDEAQAEALYSALTSKGAKVFYAPKFQAQLWGEDLYEYLADIYSKQAVFCILLISQNYVKKQWTRHEWRSAQERALSEANRAYILPIRLDDSELPGLLKTISHLDLRDTSIEEAAEFGLAKLQQYINGKQGNPAQQLAPAGKPWKYESSALQTSKFLSINHYLDPSAADFAVNTFSSALVNHLDKSQRRYLALVAVPTPAGITLDLDDVASKFGANAQQGTLGRHDETRPWLEFSLGSMFMTRTTRWNHLWYRAPSQRNPEKDFEAEQYLRISEDGGIEFVDGRYSHYAHQVGIVFNFIHTLGRTITLMNLAAYLYSLAGYRADFQLLINLVNTKDTILASFAESVPPMRRWNSPASDPIYAISFLESQQGKTSESNLQFAYDINIQRILDNPDLSFEVIEDLSKKLQRSYGYSYQPRHYISGTNEFPWAQYNRFIQF